MNEKISIIVPVYNAEKTLKECVNSLIKQTYSNIEIILVNDGSKDDSLRICKEFAEKDSRIIVIDKPNGGVSSARNAGLDIASGEYVMFCDSDDWAEIEWCRVLKENYVDNCLIMSGYFCYFNNDVQQISSNSQYILKNDYLSTKLIGGFVPWNKIFKASIIKNNHIRFSDTLTVGEDKIFVWDYLKYTNNKIYIVQQCLYNYIFPTGASLSLNFPLKYEKQCFKIFQMVREDIETGVKCSSSAWRDFCNDCYLQFENAIRSILKNNDIPLFEKYLKINNICKSKEYQESSHQAEISNNKYVKKICRNKNSIGIIILYFLKKY